MVVVVKVEDLNRSRGSSASSFILCSTQINEMIPKIPTAVSERVNAEPQPQVLPCSATKRIGTTAKMMVTAPSQSMRDFLGKCGTCKKVKTINMATRPMGKLIRKIQRQPSIHKISSTPANPPPMIGPITLLVPNTAKNNPW